MWFVYLLLCQDKSLYTGICLDPKKRFEMHKKGKGGKYTRSHSVEKIIYLEKFKTRGEALKREWKIKSWSREEKIKKLKLNI